MAMITITPPKEVGYYKLFEGIRISTTKKPKTIYRFFTKLLLGWTWVDTIK